MSQPTKRIPSKITDATYWTLYDIAVREGSSVAEVVTRLILHGLECDRVRADAEDVA